MKLLIKYSKKTIIFIIAYIFSLFFYKKKYISGKYFKGRVGGIFSNGWQWIFTDCMSRIFLGINRGIPFPISPMINIVNPKDINFHIDDLNNFQGIGKYFQAIDGGKIHIGKGCWIANNVGLITANHDLNNLKKHSDPKDIILGENCWIGMNSVILPGVILGPSKIVGAGSIVTKSFKEGSCVIAGNPAAIIKK